MIRQQVEIQLIAAVVAAACALPGVFLVLRRLALLSDAISHTILFGIAAAFLVVRDLGSPWLLLAAALTGLATVSLVELLHRTRLVREDAAIGLVFPLLFSLGVILVSRYADSAHLDVDAVLKGELVLAVWDRRMQFHGYDLGPQTLYVMAAALVLNIVFVAVFYKELKLATFDAALAAALGFSPALLHYALMALVSITAVGAFDAVGSVLVVALMIAPPAAAYLLTDRLSRMLLWSLALGIVSAEAGYWLAHFLNVSIAGAMATMSGVVFGVVFLTAPARGFVAVALRRARQRWEFAQALLAVHLHHHEGLPEAAQECRIEHLHEHLRWQPAFAARVVRQAERRGLVRRDDGHLALTPLGRELARDTLVR